MKKLLVMLVASLSVSAFGAGYGDAGCGLGSMAFGSQKGFIQIVAATLNGISGNQTFGMTSGTSNCGGAGKTAAAFIEANATAIKNDVARGEGETLSALASIYGVKNVKAMTSALKASYKDIFSTADAARIESKMRKTLEIKELL